MSLVYLTYNNNYVQYIYIGDSTAVPTASPGGISAIQDPQNPQRILMTWEHLLCLQTNSPITDYVIQFGRVDGTKGVSTVVTRDILIKSSSSTTPTGLGFLDQGVVYFFRVAARNVNGLGRYSPDALARTANLPTGEFWFIL